MVNFSYLHWNKCQHSQNNFRQTLQNYLKFLCIHTALYYHANKKNNWHKKSYSWILITWILTNSKFLVTWSNFHFLSGHFLYDVSLDNSNLFLLPLKVWVLGSRLYCIHDTSRLSRGAGMCPCTCISEVSLKFPASQLGKIFSTDLLYKKTFPKLSNQAGKNIPSASKFAWCPALNKTPGIYMYQNSLSTALNSKGAWCSDLNSPPIRNHILFSNYFVYP